MDRAEPELARQSTCPGYGVLIPPVSYASVSMKQDAADIGWSLVVLRTLLNIINEARTSWAGKSCCVLCMNIDVFCIVLSDVKPQGARMRRCSLQLRGVDMDRITTSRRWNSARSFVLVRSSLPRQPRSSLTLTDSCCAERVPNIQMRNRRSEQMVARPRQD